MNFVSVSAYRDAQMLNGYYRAADASYIQNTGAPIMQQPGLFVPHPPPKKAVRSRPVFDVNELMSGTRLQIRHISEGPPPKIQATSVSQQVCRSKKDENASCVFVVRGVNRLGDDAAIALKTFFSQWGSVASLRFACPSRNDARDFSPSLAFVVMSQSSDAATILQSEGYVIGGRRVQVEPYVRNDLNKEEDFEYMANSLFKDLDL